MCGLKNPKTRRWIALLFAVNLLLQVQTVIACSMMPGQWLDSCCCEQDDTVHAAINTGDSITGSAQSCCDTETSVVLNTSPSDNSDPIDDQALTADYFKLSLPLLALGYVISFADYNQLISGIDQQSHRTLATTIPIYQSTERYRI